MTDYVLSPVKTYLVKLVVDNGDTITIELPMALILLPGMSFVINSTNPGLGHHRYQVLNTRRLRLMSQRRRSRESSR